MKIKIIATIHNGERTHHQLQVITLHNFRIINDNNNKSKNPILFLYSLLDIFVKRYYSCRSHNFSLFWFANITNCQFTSTFKHYTISRCDYFKITLFELLCNNSRNSYRIIITCFIVSSSFSNFVLNSRSSVWNFGLLTLFSLYYIIYFILFLNTYILYNIYLFIYLYSISFWKH